MRLQSRCHAGLQSSEGLTGTRRSTSEIPLLAVGKRSVSCLVGLSRGLPSRASDLREREHSNNGSHSIITT